ncbi:16S rRNA (guanine(527)-N(7))-methyltransferase RsmG [bacterium]|nr:16S rRNA (guanine(527)-N(7))-methyltransferase RsmG [bacterium]
MAMNDLALLETSLQAAGLDLSPEMLDRFARFAELLNEWNQEINLISRKDPYGMIRRHFLDSAGLVTALDIEPGCSVMDLGSGAGFPGLPMAILRPDVSFTLVESRTGKTRFHQAVIDALKLGNVVTMAERAEALAPEVGPFDWIVSRAVADLDQLAKWCHHLIRQPGGRMAVLKGPDLDEEIKRLARRAGAWGVQGWDIHDYHPFDGIRDKESRLVVVSW